MLAVERGWARTILGSFAPEDGPGLAPRAGEIDYLAAFECLLQGATPIASLGFRLSLWLVAFSPLWMGRAFRTFAALRSAERAELLAVLLEHRMFAVREAVFLLKTAASLALFRSDAVRARSRYDGAPRASLPLHGDSP